MHLHFLSLIKGVFGFSSFGLLAGLYILNFTKHGGCGPPFELKVQLTSTNFPIFSQGEKGDVNSRESTPKPKRKLKPLFEDEVKPEDFV